MLHHQSIATCFFALFSLVLSHALAEDEKDCKTKTSCRTIFGTRGYYVQRNGIFGCHDRCALALNRFSLFGRWECGKCYSMDDFPEKVIDRTDVEYLASNELDGRLTASPGSLAAQEYIMGQLESMGAVGLDSETTGRDAYKQGFYLEDYGENGTNILAILEGSDLPDEYVLLSAHYDHITFCNWDMSADRFEVCNGASDNAAGVTAVLGISRAIAALPSRPRRSIVLAFWDSEEIGLRGSKYYVENPLVPLEKATSVLNWDILGANLLPSLRKVSIAIGSETGGSRLKSMLKNAVENEDLDVRSVSAILGQDRSDHQNFLDKDVPSIFFSDSTNGCYHTSGDEIKNLDFGKLEKQARIGLKLVYELASTAKSPAFKRLALPVRFSDATTINDLVNLAVENDLDLFAEVAQEDLKYLQFKINKIVARGRFLFPFALSQYDDIVVKVVAILRHPECTGFL